MDKPNPKLIKPNIFNEQVVLANMLKSAKSLKKILSDSAITSNTFLAVRHRIIFLILEKLDKKGLSYNEDTFVVESENTDFGKIEYLREIESKFEENQNLDHHLKLLKQDALKQQLLMEKLPELEKLLYDEKSNADDIYSGFSDILLNVKSKVTGGKKLLYGDELVTGYKKFLKDRAERPFQGCYFSEIDEKLVSGLFPGGITTVAALSSHGKSTFCGNVVSRLAAHDITTLACPLEEGAYRQMDKICGAGAKVRTEDVIKHYKTMPPTDKYEFLKFLNFISQKSLVIYPYPEMCWKDLIWALESCKPQVVMIDLFEKIVEVRDDLDQKNISQNLDYLQYLVQEYNFHAIITAQIKRDKLNERTKNKRPTVEAIKNSGKYYEASDLVLGLFRPKAINADDAGPDEVEISCLKQRNGKINWKVTYLFNGEYSFIGNYSKPKIEAVPF